MELSILHAWQDKGRAWKLQNIYRAIYRDIFLMFVYYSRIAQVAPTAIMSQCKNQFSVFTVYQHIYDNCMQCKQCKTFFCRTLCSLFDDAIGIFFF